jgi:hypothetical protein
LELNGAGRRLAQFLAFDAAGVAQKHVQLVPRADIDSDGGILALTEGLLPEREDGRGLVGRLFVPDAYRQPARDCFRIAQDRLSEVGFGLET